MTQSLNTAPPEIDPLEAAEKRISVSFDPQRINDLGEAGHAMGDWAVLEVEGYLEMVPRRNDKKEIELYDDGNQKMSVVLAVSEKGVPKSLWGKKPGGLYVALVAAQNQLREATGEPKRRIRPGDVLAVRWSALGEQPENKMYSRPKVFEARVQPGTLPQGAPAVASNDNPFENAASAPAPQPAAQQQPQPQIGGDPFASTAPAAAPTPAPAAVTPQPVQAPAATGTDDDPFGAPPAGEDAPPF